MRNIYALVIGGLTCFMGNIHAQTPNWLWAKSTGHTTFYNYNDGGVSIAVDVTGAVYVAGHYTGTADLDPGPDTLSKTSAGDMDIFISKLDASGNLMWAKSIGSSGIDESYELALDRYSNVYVTGYFHDTVDFDPGPGVHNLMSAGITDIFISKFDSAGNFVWAKSIGGQSYDVGFAITTDAESNIYTTGYFTGRVDFDPGADTTDLISTGSYNVFILKLDSSGSFIWAKSMGGKTGYSSGISITTDAYDNVYTTGKYSDTIDFDPGIGKFNLMSGATNSMFISKLDSSGNFMWAKAVDAAISKSIKTDASGNVYTTGYFYETADFDPGAGIYNITANGASGIFISKLDSSGNFVWTKAMSGPWSNFGKSLIIDDYGNVYTTGFFFGITDFDPGAGEFNLDAHPWDIFICKLDSAGNFAWVKSTYAFSGRLCGLSIAIDTSRQLYVAGVYQGAPVNFGSTIFSNPDSVMNVFIAKLSYDNITGIKSAEKINDISVFPNPAANHLTIALPGHIKNVKITISDISGKIIYSATASETQNTEVNTNCFAAGFYFIQILAPEFIETREIIIAK